MIRAVTYSIVLWACFLGAAGSASSDDAKPLKERWIPSLSGGLVIFEDRVDGTIDSSVGFSDAGAVGTTVPRLQIGLDLMSPAIEQIPSGPRILGFGGVQVVGPNEENESAGAGEFVDLAAVQANVARASIPNPSQPGIFPPPESLDNQGSVLTSTRKTAGWYLGLGMSFEFPHREEEDPALRLTPFVSYVGEQLDLNARTVIVEGQPMGIPPVGSYTIRSGLLSKKETLHYVGPGIDAEFVLASLESTTVSLFARVSFLWNVGDKSFSLADSEGLGRYKVDVDGFTIRPGGGLRVAWRGGL